MVKNMDILIMESETYLASSLAQKLENDGHICFVRQPGSSYEGHFDVVLLGTFFDPLKIIKEHQNAVIIMLANHINSDITKALKAGASDYILKPVVIEELRRKIEFYSLFNRIKTENEAYKNILDFQSQTSNLEAKTLSKLRFPLAISSHSLLNCDIFIYELSKAKNLPFIRIQGGLESLENKSSSILYFCNFDELSQKDQDQILLSEQKKVVIRSNKEIPGFYRYELGYSSRPSIMPIDEYIKYCIIEYQDNFNDTQLAEILGVSRKSLWEKRRRYGITRKK